MNTSQKYGAVHSYIGDIVNLMIVCILSPLICLSVFVFDWLMKSDTCSFSVIINSTTAITGVLLIIYIVKCVC